MAASRVGGRWGRVVDYIWGRENDQGVAARRCRGGSPGSANHCRAEPIQRQRAKTRGGRRLLRQRRHPVRCLLPAARRRPAGARRHRIPPRRNTGADRARLATSPLPDDSADPGHALARAPAGEPRRGRDTADRLRRRRAAPIDAQRTNAAVTVAANSADESGAASNVPPRRRSLLSAEAVPVALSPWRRRTGGTVEAVRAGGPSTAL